MTPFRRGVVRATSVTLLATVAALAVAQVASAHATLVTTDPANNAVLAAAPPRVVLRFDEPVETAFGSVRVFDARADRVDADRILRPSSNAVAVALPRGLDRGTYTVAWRVVSADTHPVHGAFVFAVGAPSANPESVATSVMRQQRTPRSVSTGFGVLRFLNLALLLLVGGGSVAVAALRLFDRRVELSLATAAALLAVSSLAGLLFQGAEAGGESLGRAFSWNVISTVLDTRFGAVWLARGCIAAAIAAVSLVLCRHPSVGGAVLRALAAAGAIVTGSLAGHAAAEGGFTQALDIVHISAAAVWTGGLAVVVLALWFAAGERWLLAARVVPRFSALAVAAVALLLVAGVVGGYLEVRSWHGFASTTYGRLLIAKAALVLPLLALGAYNNRYAVPRLRTQIASRLEQRRFIRAALAELAIVLVIVGVTAALVAKPPPQAAAATRLGPYSSSSQVGPYELNLTVDPAQVGHNVVHVYLLKPSGLPAAAAGVQLAASLEKPRLGPLSIPAFPAGPGHFASYAHLPLPGDWHLRLDVRRGKFDQWTTTLTIPIGGS